MAGHGNWHDFWIYHNARHPAANVRPGHKDTNLYYHFRAVGVVLCLYMNLDLGIIGVY